PAIPPTQGHGIRVRDARIGGLEPDRPLVVPLRIVVLAELVVGERERAVRIGEARVEPHGPLEVLDRQIRPALAQIGGPEIQIRLRGGRVRRAPARPGAPGEERTEHGEHEHRARGAPEGHRLHCSANQLSLSPSRTRRRSWTRPASWPQAAAMSSPRGRRIVATIPAERRVCQKRSIASGVEHSNPESRNGLNGIRLTFAGRFRSSRTSCRASAGPSFTRSSITYSNVICRLARRSAYR